MKIKSKPISNQCKIFSKHTTALITSKALKEKEATIPKNPSFSKADLRKTKTNDKQNVETSNIPSPDNNIKNKNYKPKLRKSKKLQLENTVSLVINQSTISVKKQDLLDSLLYGEVDLTYSQDFNQKEEEGEELLISGCDQTVTFKNCKNLSPIKSISEYSVTENEDQVFVVQKIETNSANAMLKLRFDYKRPDSGPQNEKKQPKVIQNVLLRRILMHFNEKPQSLLSFYCSIHQAIAKQDLYFKIRQFVFQNGIIFKKAELNQLIEELVGIIVAVNKDTKKYQFCQQNLQIMMEKIFMNGFIGQNNEQGGGCGLWLVEQIHQRLFQQKDMVSIWKLIVQLCSDVPKEVEASFRLSRFCVSMDSHQFFHQTDEKRKKDNIEVVLAWISKYLRPLADYPKKPKEDLFSTQQHFTIKISPPALH